MGRSAFHSRAALLPWHRAAGLSRGGRLPHGLSRRSPHEIVPEVLAPDIVRRFAYQRSSHGRAVGSEAATQTDDTSVEPAEALCALTPRARLTTPRDALRPLGAPPMRTRRAAERVRDWLTRSTHPPACLRARRPAVVKGPQRPGRLAVARGCESDTPLPGFLGRLPGSLLGAAGRSGSRHPAPVPLPRGRLNRDSEILQTGGDRLGMESPSAEEGDS